MANAIGSTSCVRQSVSAVLSEPMSKSGPLLPNATAYTDKTIAGTGLVELTSFLPTTRPGIRHRCCSDFSMAAAPLAVVLSGSAYSGRQVNLTWTLNAGTTFLNAPTAFQIWRSTTSAVAGFVRLTTSIIRLLYPTMIQR